MIDSELNSRLGRYFNRTEQPSGKSETPADVFQRLKAKNDALRDKTDPGAGEAAAEEKKAPASALTLPRDILDLGNRGLFSQTPRLFQPKTAAGEKAPAEAKAPAEKELTPEERRRQELKDILNRINAEEAEKHPAVAAAETDPAAATGVTTPNLGEQLGLPANLSGFLNDLPLFNEFKTGLMDAFSAMDKGTLGSISAQYELNLTTMQYVSNAAGGFDYQEKSFSLKLDFNYLKAASGAAGNGQAMADRLGQANDFASLVDILKNSALGQTGQTGKTTPSQADFLAQMQDYFSPEKTAGRIVDFATSFFPSSAAFKRLGDTEEARGEFAETMRQAIQKGFDQAMGVLGKVSKPVQDGIDKTHELTFKGIDDFVKNGLNRQKEADEIYASLEQWSLSLSASYSEKTVSVRSGAPYGDNYAALPSQPALDQRA